jgi:hypothetical protein
MKPRYDTVQRNKGNNRKYFEILNEEFGLYRNKGMNISILRHLVLSIWELFQYCLDRLEKEAILRYVNYKYLGTISDTDCGKERRNLLSSGIHY